MRVRDLMNPRVFAIRRADPLGLALQTMLWAGVRHLPVVQDGEVVGILTERDLLRHRSHIGERAALERPAAEAMTTPVEVTGPDAPIADVAARMAALKIGCLPVVEDGTLVGIITGTDILAWHGRRAFDPTATDGPLVADLMSRDPAAVIPSDGLLAAAEKMSLLGIRHLPVIDEARRVVGILSDRDVRIGLGGPPDALRDQATLRRIRTLRVADAMTAEPLTLPAEVPLLTAVGYFIDWRIGAIPVVDAAGKLAGIISYVDALRGMRDGEVLRATGRPRRRRGGGSGEMRP